MRWEYIATVVRKWRTRRQSGGREMALNGKSCLQDLQEATWWKHMNIGWFKHRRADGMSRDHPRPPSWWLLIYSQQQSQEQLVIYVPKKIRSLLHPQPPFFQVGSVQNPVKLIINPNTIHFTHKEKQKKRWWWQTHWGRGSVFTINIRGCDNSFRHDSTEWARLDQGRRAK